MLKMLRDIAVGRTVLLTEQQAHVTRSTEGSLIPGKIVEVDKENGKVMVAVIGRGRRPITSDNLVHVA